MSVEIHGAEQLAVLSKALKQAGAKDLERDLSKAISQAMKPLRQELKRSARTTLPRRGGLGDSVARSQMRMVRRVSGVRFQTRHARRSLQTLDQGTVRHPVFGNRSRWVTQNVSPNWWSGPTNNAADQIRQEIQKAMDNVAKKLSWRTW